MKILTLLFLLSSCLLHHGLPMESCGPSHEYITFLQTQVKKPIEHIIDGVLDGTKNGLGMEETTVTAMKAIIQVRGSLLQRLGVIRRGKLVPCDGDLVRETETVKDVKIRISEVLDQSMRGKGMSVSGIRKMTTDLLKIKLILDKEIMRLMMLPEEEETDSKEDLCGEIEKVVQNLEDVTTCDEMQMNEVDVDEAVGNDCFSWQHLMDDLAELAEKVETGVAEVFGDLHNTVTDDDREEDISWLHRLNTVREGLETVLTDVRQRRGSLAVGGVIRNVRKLYRLCQGSEESLESESVENCPLAEYTQSKIYVDTFDNIIKSSKASSGDIDDIKKIVMLGLIEVQRQMEERVIFLFSSELCCLEEMEEVKGSLMPVVTSCMETVTNPSSDQETVMDCILDVRGLVEFRRTALVESQVTPTGNGTDRNCPCYCKKAARRGICLERCKQYVGVEECCACSQDCKLTAKRGQCLPECQVWGHGACCHRTCEERCTVWSTCPGDCRTGKDVTVTESPHMEGRDTEEETNTVTLAVEETDTSTESNEGENSTVTTEMDSYSKTTEITIDVTEDGRYTTETITDSEILEITSENNDVTTTSTSTDYEKQMTTTKSVDKNPTTLTSITTAVTRPPIVTPTDTVEPISPVVMMMDASFNFSLTASDLCFHEIADMTGERVGQYSFVSPEGEIVEVHYTAGKDGFQILNPDQLPESLPFSLCSPQISTDENRPQSSPPSEHTTNKVPYPNTVPYPGTEPFPSTEPSSNIWPSPSTAPSLNTEASPSPSKAPYPNRAPSPTASLPPNITPPSSAPPSCPPSCLTSLPWQRCPSECSDYPLPPPCCTPPCPPKCGRGNQVRQPTQCSTDTRLRECLYIKGCCPEHFDVVFGSGVFFQEGK